MMVTWVGGRQVGGEKRSNMEYNQKMAQTDDLGHQVWEELSVLLRGFVLSK